MLSNKVNTELKPKLLGLPWYFTVCYNAIILDIRWHYTLKKKKGIYKPITLCNKVPRCGQNSTKPCELL